MGKIMIGRHADSSYMSGECYRWNYTSPDGRFISGQAPSRHQAEEDANAAKQRCEGPAPSHEPKMEGLKRMLRF